MVPNGSEVLIGCDALSTKEGSDADSRPESGAKTVRYSDWQACSRAVAKSCILAKRCSGSLASAFSTTCSTAGEIVGTFSRKGGGGTRVCLIAISVNDP